ncbi:MAG: N-acetyltransferase [Paludibacteraceae bacterium]|nr:N-acetyltransferase [Paludibacteraceae bacterium]
MTKNDGLNVGRLVRLTRAEDIPSCLALYDKARRIMRSSGNMNQWTNGYPSEEILRDDVSKSNSYVIEEGGVLVATFACIVGEDPTYAVIEDGSWLVPDVPYATIHRLASTPDSHGIAMSTFDFASSLAPTLRVDTHADNFIMQHVLQGYGFSRRGIIYLANGDPRIAYQFIQ